MTTDAARVRVAYFVPPSKNFAGLERVVHDIATGLAEYHGDVLDVHVVFCSGYDERVLDAPAYTKHVLGVDRLRHLTSALRTCTARERFDVLITPQIEMSTITWFATRGLGVPVFLAHLHGNPRIEEVEGTRRSRAAFLAFRHVVTRRATAVLTVSPSLARYAEAALVKGAPVRYVENPVRSLPGTLAERGDGTLKLVCVARLNRQKGQDLLLEALAAARDRLPPVTLTLVGSAKLQEEEDALRALSTRLGLDDVVVFAGYATDPSRHLREADVFVLASRWEGFGVALVEALSMGLPVLSTDCEFGPADVITDPRIGDLVPAGDVAALAEGLVRAAARVRNPEDEKFRRDVARGWSQEAATAAHFRVLREVCASRPSSPRLAALVDAP